MIKRRIYGKEFEFKDENDAAIQQLAVIVFDKIFMSRSDKHFNHYFKMLTEFPFNEELYKYLREGIKWSID